jgi:hypothetical protein
MTIQKSLHLTNLASKICEPYMDTLGGIRVNSCRWQSKNLSICQLAWSRSAGQLCSWSSLSCCVVFTRRTGLIVRIWSSIFKSWIWKTLTNYCRKIVQYLPLVDFLQRLSLIGYRKNPWKCRKNFQNYRRLSEQSFESYVWGYMKAVTSSVKKVFKRFSKSVCGKAEANKNIKFNFLHNKASRIFKNARCSLLILF